MGQLMMVALHSLYFSMFSSCDLYPSYFAYTIGFLSLMLLGLFGNFFYRTYIKNSTSSSIKVQLNGNQASNGNVLFDCKSTEINKKQN